jgi:hypothetical protein
MKLVSTSFVNNYAHGDGGAGCFDQSHYYFSMQDTDSYAKTGHLESDHPYTSRLPDKDGNPTVLESLDQYGPTEVSVLLGDE